MEIPVEPTVSVLGCGKLVGGANFRAAPAPERALTSTSTATGPARDSSTDLGKHQECTSPFQRIGLREAYTRTRILRALEFAIGFAVRVRRARGSEMVLGAIQGVLVDSTLTVNIRFNSCTQLRLVLCRCQHGPQLGAHQYGQGSTSTIQDIAVYVAVLSLSPHDRQAHNSCSHI